MPPTGGTSPTVSVSSFDIGPCRVKQGSTDLGGSLKNVTVKYKYEKVPLKADQFGSTVLDMAISGMDVTVETDLAETQNKSTFSKVFPSALLAGTSPHQYLQFNEQTGLRQLSLAETLELHPLVKASSEKDTDWYFWKALPLEDSTYVFGPAEQQTIHVTWRILLDTSTTPARMFRAGDQSL